MRPTKHGFLTSHFWTLAVEEHFYLFLSLYSSSLRSGTFSGFGVAGVIACLWPFAPVHCFPHANQDSGLRDTDIQPQYLPATWFALLLQQDDSVVGRDDG